MNIASSEYELRRHAFNLCRWINDKLHQMEEAGSFNELYFERKWRGKSADNIKRLIEEAIPVSRLALHLSRPGNEVFVTLYPKEEKFDARIEVEGFMPHSFKVEVTTTEDDETTMRRQALSREGFVNLTGPICRKDKKVISSGEFVDMDEEEKRIAALMFERMEQKVASGRYDSETAILVYMTQLHPRVGLDVRGALVRKTEHYVLETQHKPHSVFYCYARDLTVDIVGNLNYSDSH